MNTPGISREFSTGELLRFAAPSIVMMLFLSMYTIVDGFFISRYVGTAALSATNIVYPLIGFFLAVGIMFATGGSAVVASEMGRGEHQEASGHFTAVVLTAVPAGATAVGVPSRVVRMDGVPVRYADAVDQIHVEDPICRELEGLRERLAQLEEIMEHQTHTKERTA